MTADPKAEEEYPFEIRTTEAALVIDLMEMVRGIVEDLLHGLSPSRISGKFHRTAARLVVETCERIRRKQVWAGSS